MKEEIQKFKEEISNALIEIMKDFHVEEIEYKPEYVEFSNKVKINITNIMEFQLQSILFINDKLIKALKENDSERIEMARELLNISISNMLNKNNK